MIRGAVISEDGTYRYSLWRHWGPGQRRLAYVMLNPSTADAEVDDPTIRRCMGFARREEFDGIEVLNLFAYRATNPKDMMGIQNGILKGAENEWHQERVLSVVDAVVFAWGANQFVKGFPWYPFDVAKLAHSKNLQPLCLGVTKDGSPRHPLYVAGDQPLIPWEPS